MSEPAQTLPRGTRRMAILTMLTFILLLSVGGGYLIRWQKQQDIALSTGQQEARRQAEAEEQRRREEAESLYQQGLKHCSGEGAEKHIGKAAVCFRKAAELNHAEAQNELAFCYHIGAGVERNEAEALRWYQSAAALGDAQAMFNTGLYHAMGRGGLNKNPEQAALWYRRAADKGNARAQYALGTLCEQGKIPGCGAEEAAEWYQKAADGGSEAAKKELERFKN